VFSKAVGNCYRDDILVILNVFIEPDIVHECKILIV